MSSKKYDVLNAKLHTLSGDKLKAACEALLTARYPKN